MPQNPWDALRSAAPAAPPPTTAPTSWDALRSAAPAAPTITSRGTDAEFYGAAPNVPNPLDTVLPGALRIGGGIVGGAGGSAFGPAGTVVGSLVGGGLGELAAEAYETSRGLRSEVNLPQVATQAAINAIPFTPAVKGASAARLVIGRAAQGAALTGAADVITRRVEGEGWNAPDPAALGLGLVLGGVGGAAEARFRPRAGNVPAPPTPRVLSTADAGSARVTTPDLTSQPTSWAALREGAPADAPAANLTTATPKPAFNMRPTADAPTDVRLAPDKLEALREVQNATPPSSMWDAIVEPVREARRHFVNRFQEVDTFLRQGGVNPETLDAARNPSKLIDIATGGVAGKVHAQAVQLRNLVRDAKAAGLDDALQDVLNLNAMEAGADTLSRRAGREAADDLMGRAPRSMGRDAQQQTLLELETRPTEPVQPSLLDTPSRTPLTADLSRVAEDARDNTIRLGKDAKRVDRFTTTPHVPMTPEAPAVPAAAQPEQTALPGFEPSTPSREPRQPTLDQLPTPWEFEAMNARIDRTKLHDVNTLVRPFATPRFSADDVTRIAQDLDVSVEHVKAFTDAAHAKGGLPEWLVRREITDAKRRGSWALAAGEAGQLDERLQAGKALPLDTRPSDLREARLRWEARTDLTPEQKTAVLGYAKRIFEVNQRALDTAASAGLIRPEVVADLRARAARAAQTGTGGYVPLTRVLDDVEATLRGAGVQLSEQHVLYRLNGSEKVTRHPIEATLDRMAVVLQEAERNKAVASLVRLRGQNRFFADNIIPLNANRPAGAPTNVTVKGDTAKVPEGFSEISVLEGGVAKKYAVPTPLADALKGGDPASTNIIIQTLSKFAAIFRAGTTMANTAFAIPNVARDVSDLSIFTNQSRVAGLANPQLWAAWGKAWKDVATQSPEYLRYLNSGAAFSTFQRNIDDVQQYLRVGPSKGARTFPNPLAAAAWLNNTMEEATKLTALRQFEGQGLSKAEAAWRTRRFGGSPDFARKGASMKTANMLVPFLNAQIQGLARLGAYARRHPEQAATAAAATMAKLLMLQQINNSWQDPDGTRSWDRIPQRDKEQNWILITPFLTQDAETGIDRHVYLKIPAGHTANLLRGPVQALIDPTLRTAEGVTNTLIGALPTSPSVDFDRPLGSLFQSGMAATNPAIRVPTELWSNHDTYRDVPIVPRRLQGVEARQRFTDTTSPTARAIGDVANVSPLLLEHAVRGFTGGVGESVLAAADSLQSTPNRKPVTDIPGLQQVTEAPVVGGLTRPIVRRFVSGPGTIDAQANAIKNDFYATLNKANETRATYNLMRTRGDLAGMQKLAGNERQRQLYMAAPRLAAASQRLAEIRRSGDTRSEAAVLQQIQQMLSTLKE